MTPPDCSVSPLAAPTWSVHQATPSAPPPQSAVVCASDVGPHETIQLHGFPPSSVAMSGSCPGNQRWSPRYAAVIGKWALASLTGWAWH